MNKQSKNYLTRLLHVIIAVNAIMTQDDCFHDSFYMKESDQYKMNLLSMIDGPPKTIDFLSNNDKVKIPGIGNGKNLLVHLEKHSFQPLKVYDINDKIFVLSRDQRTVLAITQDEEQNYILIQSVIQHKLNTDVSIQCNDIRGDNEYRVYLLCYNAYAYKNNSETMPYTLFAFNVDRNELIYEVKFQNRYHSNPKFLFIDNLNNNNEDDERFVIYNKTANKSHEDKEELIQAISVKHVNGEAVVSSLGDMSLEVLLMNTNLIKLKLVDLFFFNDHLYAHVSLDNEDNIKEKVFSCNVNSASDQLNISNCDYLVQDSITLFKMYNHNYTFANDKGKIYFCKINAEECKEGDLYSKWNVINVLTKKDVALALVEINGNVMYLIYDYIKDSYYWKREDFSNVIYRRIIHFGTQRGDESYRLIEFMENGFRERDLTFNSHLEIKASDVANYKRVKLYLEGSKIVDLDIKLYDGNSIVETSRNETPYTISSGSEFLYFQVNYAGSDLRLEAVNGNVYYYNRVDTNMLNSIVDSKEGINIKSFQNLVLVIKMRSIDVLECRFTEGREYKCDVKGTVYSDSNLNIDKIKDVRRIGDVYMIIYDELAELKLFEKKKKNIRPAFFKRTPLKSSQCRYYYTIIYCLKSNEDENADSIIFYKMVDNVIKEDKRLNLRFAEEFNKIKASFDNYEVQRYVITRFDVDVLYKNKLYILVQFKGASKSEIRMYKFTMVYSSPISSYTISLKDRFEKIEKNSLITEETYFHMIDNHMLFISPGPEYTLFFYNRTGYYLIESLHIQHILSLEILVSHDLMGLIFQNDIDKEYYYAVIQITKNAVQQIIRVDRIVNYTHDTRIHLINMTSTVAGVLIYNCRNISERTLYVFYFNGPYMISDDQEAIIKTKNNEMTLALNVDKGYNTLKVDLKSETKIDFKALDKRVNVDLDSYWTIFGNIKEMHVLTQTTKHSHIVLPTDKRKEKVVAFINEPKLIKKRSFVSSDDAWLSFQTSANEFTIIPNGTFTKDTETKKVDISFVAEYQCIEVVTDDFNLYCYRADYSRYYLTIKNLITGKETEIKLPIPGTDLKIIYDNLDELIFVMKQEHRKAAIIYEYDKKEDKLYIKYIGKKKFYADNFNITDYHFYYNHKYRQISIVVLDQISNKLYMLLYSLKEKNIIKVLQRNKSLKAYGSNFKSLVCTNLHDKFNRIECVLTSPFSHVILRIRRIPGASFSKFSWKVSKMDAFYNMFYESCTNEIFQPLIAFDDKYLAVTDGNNKIFFYRRNQKTGYTYHQLNIEDKRTVLHLVFSNGVLYNYLSAKESELIVQAVDLEPYQLSIDTESAGSEPIEVVIEFQNGSSYAVPFHLENEAKTMSANKRKIDTAEILKFSVITVGILIIGSLLFLAALLKERKSIVVQRSFNPVVVQ